MFLNVRFLFNFISDLTTALTLENFILHIACIHFRQAEEASLRMSIEISDLLELIHREAPWVTRSTAHLTVADDSRDSNSLDYPARDDMARLARLCKTLICSQIQMQQRLSENHVATLDSTRFDTLVTESKDVVKFLSLQGPSAGFVEADLREIQELREALAEAEAMVVETLGEMQVEILKSQQRVKLLVGLTIALTLENILSGRRRGSV